MKSQRFRFRLIAVLLMGLILFAGVYGLKAIPGYSADSSLSEAILRLTGGLPSSKPSAASDAATPTSENPASSLWNSVFHKTEAVVSPSVSVTPAQTFDSKETITVHPSSTADSFSNALVQLFDASSSPSPDSEPSPTPNTFNL